MGVYSYRKLLVANLEKITFFIPMEVFPRMQCCIPPSTDNVKSSVTLKLSQKTSNKSTTIGGKTKLNHSTHWGCLRHVRIALETRNKETNSSSPPPPPYRLQSLPVSLRPVAGHQTSMLLPPAARWFQHYGLFWFNMQNHEESIKQYSSVADYQQTNRFKKSKLFYRS